MSDWQQLAAALGLTLALSLTALAVIRRPLFTVLEYVCATGIAARFWTAYASVLIVLAPLCLAAFLLQPNGNPVAEIQSTIATAATGLIGAFIIMGLAVSMSVAKVLAAPNPPAPASAPSAAE